MIIGLLLPIDLICLLFKGINYLVRVFIENQKVYAVCIDIKDILDIPLVLTGVLFMGFKCEHENVEVSD